VTRWDFVDDAGRDLNVLQIPLGARAAASAANDGAQIQHGARRGEELQRAAWTPHASGRLPGD
jgi:hypothetical protein